MRAVCCKHEITELSISGATGYLDLAKRRRAARPRRRQRTTRALSPVRCLSPADHRRSGFSSGPADRLASSCELGVTNRAPSVRINSYQSSEIRWSGRVTPTTRHGSVRLPLLIWHGESPAIWRPRTMLEVNERRSAGETWVGVSGAQPCVVTGTAEYWAPIPRVRRLPADRATRRRMNPCRPAARQWP